ncbi:MAG: M24 family metallopeptidase [Christensenellales bacterium]|jgi:Xaa-Pro aminopeptidase
MIKYSIKSEDGIDKFEILMNSLKKAGAAAAVLSSFESIRWISGFSGEGYVLVSGAARVVFTDARYTGQAALEAKGFEVIEATRHDMLEKVNDRLKRLKADKAGVEFDALSVSEFYAMRDALNASLVNIDDCRLWRMVKTEDELAVMRRAASIAEEAFSKTLLLVKPGMSEMDAATELDYNMRKLGAQGQAFDTIAAAGPNAAMAHHRPSNKKFEPGEGIVFDFGCVVSGYRSDMTRTVFIGNPDKQMRDVYDIVLRAHMEALAQVRDGVLCRYVDAAARDVITAAGYGEKFGHGTGHGVGLAIHEAPTLNAVSRDTLKSGMTVTVEPGIYISGVGGVRIENLVAVTKDGYEDFCSFSRELLIL